MAIRTISPIKFLTTQRREKRRRRNLRQPLRPKKAILSLPRVSKSLLKQLPLRSRSYLQSCRVSRISPITILNKLIPQPKMILLQVTNCNNRSSRLRKRRRPSLKVIIHNNSNLGDPILMLMYKIMINILKMLVRIKKLTSSIKM